MFLFILFLPLTYFQGMPQKPTFDILFYLLASRISHKFPGQTRHTTIIRLRQESGNDIRPTKRSV